MSSLDKDECLASRIMNYQKLFNTADSSSSQKTEIFVGEGFMYIRSDKISKSFFGLFDSKSCEIGISETEKGFVIRVISDSAENIVSVFDEIENIFT